jgi:hypothetical protein
MDMKQLAAIEHHYNAVLPDAYKLWAANGYLTLSSPHYLWVWEAEWIPLEQVPGYELTPFPHLPGLIPFAFTAGGDHWCWHTEGPTGPGEYRILRCQHDSDMAEVYSPSFAGWFYRVCLTHACCVDDDPKAIEEGKLHLGLWADRLEELGQGAWADDLRRLAACSPFPYRWGPPNRAEFGFLTFDECDSRIRQAFGRDYVDQEIPCQQ